MSGGLVILTKRSPTLHDGGLRLKDEKHADKARKMPGKLWANVLESSMIEWSTAGRITWSTLPGSLLKEKLTAFWLGGIPFPHPQSGYGHDQQPWTVGASDAKSATSLTQFAMAAKSPYPYDWARLTHHLQRMYPVTAAQLKSINEAIRGSFPTVLSFGFNVLATSVDCDPATAGQGPLALPSPTAIAFNARLDEITGESSPLEIFCLQEEAEQEQHVSPMTLDASVEMMRAGIESGFSGGFPMPSFRTSSTASVDMKTPEGFYELPQTPFDSNFTFDISRGGFLKSIGSSPPSGDSSLSILEEMEGTGYVPRATRPATRSLRKEPWGPSQSPASVIRTPRSPIPHRSGLPLETHRYTPSPLSLKLSKAQTLAKSLENKISNLMTGSTSTWGGAMDRAFLPSGSGAIVAVTPSRRMGVAGIPKVGVPPASSILSAARNDVRPRPGYDIPVDVIKAARAGLRPIPTERGQMERGRRPGLLDQIPIRPQQSGTVIRGLFGHHVDPVYYGASGVGLTNPLLEGPLSEDKMWEVALANSKAAQQRLLKENDALRDVILECANALQTLQHTTVSTVTKVELEEPELIPRDILFSTNSTSTQAETAQEKLRELLGNLQEALTKVGSMGNSRRQSLHQREEEVQRIQALQAANATLQLQLRETQEAARAQGLQLLEQFVSDARFMTGKRQAADLSIELMATPVRDVLVDRLEGQRKHLESERAKFTEATLDLGREKATLEAERLKFLEEKRASEVRSILDELPTTPEVPGRRTTVPADPIPEKPAPIIAVSSGCATPSRITKPPPPLPPVEVAAVSKPSQATRVPKLLVNTTAAKSTNQKKAVFGENRPHSSKESTSCSRSGKSGDSRSSVTSSKHAPASGAVVKRRAAGGIFGKEREAKRKMTTSAAASTKVLAVKKSTSMAAPSTVEQVPRPLALAKAGVLPGPAERIVMI